MGIIATLVTAAPASACPSCPVGQQARSQVWNEGFGYNLFVAALPFLVIGLVCWCAEAIGRSQAPEAATGDATDDAGGSLLTPPIQLTIRGKQP